MANGKCLWDFSTDSQRSYVYIVYVRAYGVYTGRDLTKQTDQTKTISSPDLKSRLLPQNKTKGNGFDWPDTKTITAFAVFNPVFAHVANVAKSAP